MIMEENEVSSENAVENVETKSTEIPEEVPEEIPEEIPEDIPEETPTSDGNYDPKNVHYEGDLAIYTDPSTKYQFEWDKDKSEWVPHTKVEYGFEDDTHTYTDTDGIKYFWDKDKSAWFPKIDDDFMAQYQMNYGFIDNTTPAAKTPPEPPEEDSEKPDEPKGMKRKPSEPSWFELDERKNTKVYVSNLPTDITEEDYVELMQKYGIIMRDTNTNKLKVKLYRDPETNDIKGDALCTYIKRESVELALKLLDGLEFKGKKIQVEMAQFQLKGDYDPKRKPKTKRRKDKEKLKRQQEKLFDWRPEKQIGERGKNERSVVLRNVFDSKEFDEDVALILTLQDTLRDMCLKSGGVRKVIIYDRHPEGVAQVNMKEPEEADAVVVLLHNTMFRERLITAEIWDGRTKFKIAETDSEISTRIAKWDKFLESEDTKSDLKKPSSPEKETTT